MSAIATYCYANNGSLRTLTGNAEYEQYESATTATGGHGRKHSPNSTEKNCVLGKPINDKIVNTGDYSEPRICYSYRSTKIFVAVGIVFLSLILALFGLHFSHQAEWRTDSHESSAKSSNLSVALQELLKDNIRHEMEIYDLHIPGMITNPASSCEKIKQHDTSSINGLYFLKDLEGNVFQTYCDMETAGGGWTLVASVHENDIKGKCTASDRWSSKQGMTRAYSSLWENTDTYGLSTSAARDDYKNPAYFASDAKNVMIWHVPNGTPVTQFAERALLIYHTENYFLQSYGGNLRYLFARNYTMQSATYAVDGSDDGPAIPIVWDTENNTTVSVTYKSSLKNVVEEGYIQLRMVEYATYIAALCPGLRIKGQSRTYTESFCIGTTSASPYTHMCNDFAMMEQGYAKPELTRSAVMIFYR